MRKLVLASVGCFLLCALSPALAADLPLKGPPAPYVAPYYNWTGFYLGFNGGYGFGTSDWAGTSAGNFSTSGPALGGTIGYNYQLGAYVFGLEGDLDWADIKGTACAGGCKTSDSWLGTARVRIGYAFDRWLPYLTAGGAFGDVKATSATGSSTKVKIGWTAGAGIEWAFLPAWSAKLEYLYVDLGSGTCDGTCSAAPIDVKFQTSLVRAGINYHF